MSESEGYRLIIDKRGIAECKKCPNYEGDCGTPCVNCEVGHRFNEEWTLFLYLDGKFSVYKKRKEKNEDRNNLER